MQKIPKSKWSLSSHLFLIYTLTFWFLLPNRVHAFNDPDTCNLSISGRVLDIDTKKPIPFSTIWVEESKVRGVADVEGYFTLEGLCQSEFNLLISSLGYKPLRHHHDPHHRGSLTVYLTDSTTFLESILVEGKLISQEMESLSFEQIQAEELDFAGSGSLGDVLGSIQGVSFSSIGNNVKVPIIHGLQGNRILIVNNGLKHGFQNWGSDHAPEIDLNSADNITVIKGAAGVRYGPEALGGVVLIEADPLKLSNSFYGQLGTQYQTNGRGYHTNFEVGEGFDRLSYHIGGSYTRIGDRKSPDYFLTNSGKQEWGLNAGLRYHLPNWDFEIFYSYLDQDLTVLRASVTENISDFARLIDADEPIFIRDFSYRLNEPKQITQHHLIKAAVNWYSGFGDFSLILGQQFNDRQEFDVRRDADLPIIDLSISTLDIQLDWAHPEVGGWEGNLGFQYFTQNNDNNPGTGTTPFVPNYNTYRFSTYLVEQIEKGRSTFELGARGDFESSSIRGRIAGGDIFRNEFNFSNFTGTLGWVYEFSNQMSFRTNLGTAFRFPNVAELYSFGQHGPFVEYGLWRFYFDEEGNPRTDRVLNQDDLDVQLEKGYKWVNDWEYDNGKNRLHVTAYLNYIENYVFDGPVGVTRTIGGPTPYFIYDQTDVFFLGLDFTLTHAFSSQWKGTLGFSLLHDLIGENALVNQPPNQVNYALNWTLPQTIKGMINQLRLEGGYTFRQFQAPRTVSIESIVDGTAEVGPESEPFDFMDAPDGYFLLGASWTWELGHFGGRIEVQNLLNTRYRDYLNQNRYFADDLGRNFLFNLYYKF